MGTGARFGPQETHHESCQGRTVRVWNTHSQWQREAIAKEGPLHNEKLFLLREAVASSRERKFVERLRDTADEELLAPKETFASAAHREPVFTEELDRTDEVAEAEVDEETSSLAQQRLLLRAHVNLGHPTFGEIYRALRNGQCRRAVVRWAK